MTTTPITAHDLLAVCPLCKALFAGGITAVEITRGTPAGLDAIAVASAALPELTVGAGSVLTTAQVDRVIDAGARFVVSPGLHASVVARCAEHGAPALPGVATASEGDERGQPRPDRGEA